MKNLTPFKALSAQMLPRLAQYVPVVDRVHGAHHPEFHDVRKVFESLQFKVKGSSTLPNLSEEFNQLQAITGNYVVPGDVCETYEAVYTMLKALDHAYTEETQSAS